VDATDVSAERSRLERLVKDRRRAVDGYRGKLSNAGYLAKAPPDVVAQTRRMLEAAEADLQAAERAMEALGTG
jgi:valyl-tRNA synthetase